MVQILPAVTTFGEKLVDSLSNAAGHLAQGYQKKLEGERSKTALSILQDPSKTPMQKVSAFMTLPENLKKSSAPIWAAILGPQAQAEANQGVLNQFKEKYGMGTSPMGQQMQEGTNGMVNPNPQMIPNAQQMNQEALPSGDAPDLNDFENQGAQPQIQAQSQPEYQPKGDPSDMKNWDPQLLREMLAIGGPIGEVAKDAIKRQEAERTEDIHKKENIRKEKVGRETKLEMLERKSDIKGSEKARDEANALRKSLRGSEAALHIGRQAIETGETGPFSWNNVVNSLGYPGLMNAAGTQLNQAGKEFFFGNMMKVSAKAQNQWLEQRITQLAASVGDTQTSALIKQTMLEGELQMGNAYLESYDKLAAEDIQKYGRVKGDIEERAFKDSEAKSLKVMDEVSYKTRQLYEEEKGVTWLSEHSSQKVPKGTYLTPQMAKIFAMKYDGDFKQARKVAEKLGYTIPTRQDAEKWQ